MEQIHCPVRIALGVPYPPRTSSAGFQKPSRGQHLQVRLFPFTFLTAHSRHQQAPLADRSWNSSMDQDDSDGGDDNDPDDADSQRSN